MSQLVPQHAYSFASDTLPEPRERVYSEGMLYGVFFAMEPEHFDFILGKIEAWFEHRDEIILIDHDLTSKQQLAYIMLEWAGCEIDPLFLAILEHEEVIIDFCVYERPEVMA